MSALPRLRRISCEVGSNAPPCLAVSARLKLAALSLRLAELQQKLADKGSGNKFATAVSSWVRQRAYPLWAVQELGGSKGGMGALGGSGCVH